MGEKREKKKQSKRERERDRQAGIPFADRGPAVSGISPSGGVGTAWHCKSTAGPAGKK